MSRLLVIIGESRELFLGEDGAQPRQGRRRALGENVTLIFI